MSEFNMDALLDGTLDALADMPEFKPYNAGVHLCGVKITQKKIGKYPAFEFALKLRETIEQADASIPPMEAGAEATVAFFMDHENETVKQMGQGKFKLIMAEAAKHFGEKSVRELIEDINGSDAIVVTGLRENKEKTKKFTDIESMRWAA